MFEKKQQGDELVKAAFANRKLLADRLGDVSADKRVRTYMANPDLGTYGSGKYTGLMMEHAGAYNVAAATIKRFQTGFSRKCVGMESCGDFGARSLS